VERGLIQSLHNRASTIRQEGQDLFIENSSLTRDVQLNGYPQGYIDSVINSKGSRAPICEGCFREDQTYEEAI
jgi:hypothetical protein